LKFPKFSLNNELNELSKFENLELHEKQIVFYSEDKNSWFIFESLINELIDKYDVSICYVTSSKDEPILKSHNLKIKTFCVGDGIARTKFFLNLKTKILIMTMPDLETFHIKKSKIYPVHYIHVFHAMVSTHLVYNKGAFDHFDSIFCVGNYQIEEIRSTEQIYNLKPKNLIQYGYVHLDNLIKKYALVKKYDEQKTLTTILLAPSWGKKGLFESICEDVVEILLVSGFKVILRLHPMTQKNFKKKISQINKKFSSNKNFILEQNIPNFDSFVISDIMISDWSGVALEYAFAMEKPVLYIDVPKKINNSNFEDISEIPLEISIRNKIGGLVSVSDLELLPEKIKELLKNSDLIKTQITQFRSENFFNVGDSAKIGGKQIMNILNQLKNN
jgi:YidC/Oxa1 family membrane protein insertase